LPAWLAPAVLRIWQRGAEGNDAVTQPISACLRNWGGLSASLRRRWPNPIRASFKMGMSPFNPLPRPVTQLAAFWLRACQYVLHKVGAEEEVPVGPFTVHPARIR
jgi:hypothetical protein